MERDLQQAVEKIHANPTRIVIYITGGASHITSWLLSVPGASATILEAGVPYDRRAFLHTVGPETSKTITSFCSTTAARALAKAAYHRAVSLAPPGVRVCGVAAACSLITTKPSFRDHEAFIATHSVHRIADYHIKLKKGHRNRWQEEYVSSRLVLQALEDACAILSEQPASRPIVDSLILSRQSGMSLVRDVLVKGDVLVGPEVHEQIDCVEGVIRGDIKFAEVTNGVWNREATRASLIMPGSYNPLHYGHRHLMEAARTMYPDAISAYEVSVANAAKASITSEQLISRLSQFDSNDSVIISQAPLFLTKGRLFPNSCFVVGVDTALRIVDPKYYGGHTGMISALIGLKTMGCSFLVAGRLQQQKEKREDAAFQKMENVPIPVGFEDMFKEIPEGMFREDISSTEIRSRNR